MKIVCVQMIDQENDKISLCRAEEVSLCNCALALMSW